MKIKNLDSQIPYYEIYAGNSRFCFKGHCLAGYDRMQFIGTGKRNRDRLETDVENFGG